ncbi:MAG: NADH-quinone oxidoreductase subunit [Acidimicrobiaceae bacterium]|jgi:NADH-quinone oxidoreductase subunit A|nr:NADH-quinone oxidoreductase subunit [Acidimicrobiaceae bacterium]MDQ1367366.1 NADH-quinone oxidoreductase subunit [Acidimicrobiaceae bacterium]MDQ1398442.1 NADH-quinone oxidoreductase subunit [Acidimicrobiaceae bacterium]MDQ1414318.1 NADH-quinone oxidoreductase subunit [Acidimicrobiaceae bacterium]MDQ1416389.1 NADH-quinone oxidoreductase subunit [Acidimicrobiaceae bacterium]
MAQYLPIVVLMVLATGFAFVSLLASRILGPKNPNSAKSAPYECGIVPNRQPAQRFPVRFYLVAMIFVIFDIEIIFIYPWAVMYHQLGTFGLAEMVAFSIAVLVAFLYLISGGALDWGPVKRLSPAEIITRPYTGSATIRRVPRPEALLAGIEPMEGSAPDAPAAPSAPAEPDRVPATTGH